MKYCALEKANVLANFSLILTSNRDYCRTALYKPQDLPDAQKTGSTSFFLIFPHFTLLADCLPPIRRLEATLLRR